MASSQQRGFSLVEITVAVAIVAVIAASSIAFALATRPTALWAATTQFDSMLSAARSIGAAYGDGATIFVSASPGPSNFRADLYAHRPSANANATPMPSQVQPIVAGVAISESQVLGQPPFAIIIHGNGDIGVRKNYSRGDPVTAAELPCPASNQLVFVFTVNDQTATRTLPCHTPLAYTGQTHQLPPPAAGPTPTPWAAPSCDAADNGCPTTSAPAATPPPCPAGTTLYNGICRAPLVLTVVGPTAVSGECDWTSALIPCAILVSEQYYPPPNVFTITSSTSAPCTGNYSISGGSGSGSLVLPNAYTGSSPTTWTTTPQSLDGTSCTLIVYDDRGPSDPNGSASFKAVTAVGDPIFPCPNGVIVGPGTPCPTPSVNPCAATCSIGEANIVTTETLAASAHDPNGTDTFEHSLTYTIWTTTDGGNTWTEGLSCSASASYVSPGSSGYGDGTWSCNNGTGGNDWPPQSNDIGDGDGGMSLSNLPYVYSTIETGTIGGTNGCLGFVYAWNSSSAPSVTTLPFTTNAGMSKIPAGCT